MKPAQRVETITAIASALKDKAWSEIDLILRQFGFPWSDSWRGGGQYDYVLEHVEGQEDEKLLELQEFVTSGGSSDSVPELSSLTGPWKPQRFRLLASHISADRKLVSDVKAELEAFGVDTFVAHQDIEPTLEWQQEIGCGAGVRLAG